MRNITFTQAIRETLAQELRNDESVFLLGEDIGVYGGAFGVTRGLIDEFGPERIRNTPISEQAITGIAIGAAVAGLRPVMEIMFMDFITLAVDQMVNLAAKLHPIYGQKCPMVLRTPPGAGRGYGATHSQSLERLFLGTPGIKVVAPSNALDASALLQASIHDDNPVIFLEHKLLYPLRFEMPDELPPPQPIGFAKRVTEGDDITIVAWSYMTILARRAAAELANDGYSVEVIDLCSLSPLDMYTVLESVTHTGRAIVVEEGPLTGGFSAEIAARIAEGAQDYLEAPVRRITSPDLPFPASKPLELTLIPSVADIKAAVKEMCE